MAKREMNNAVMSEIKVSKLVCIDVETNGVNWLHNKVFGVALAWINPQSQSVDSTYFDVREQPQHYDWLRNNSPDFFLVNHNVKFDLHMLENDGIKFDLNRVRCTMIAAALIDEHRMSYSLDALAGDYLNENKHSELYQQLADIFGGQATRNVQMRNIAAAPSYLVAPYACIDAELALKLHLLQTEEISNQNLQQVYDLECRLFRHIYNMERRGIAVDLDEADSRSEMLNSEINFKQDQLNQKAGTEINPNPSGSIHELFKPVEVEDGKFKCVDGTIVSATGAGKPSLDAEALGRMKHPCAALILNLRKLKKTRDTFIASHIIGHAHNGRVHPNINQTKGTGGGTGTGRLSYNGPALQQIPSRDKQVAKIVRPIFIPDDDQGWTYGDLDQHELRIFHHYVNDPKIVNAYRQNPDLDGHQVVADLTGLPRDAKKSGDMRNAKQMNLAMVFNMGGGELASAMGLPYTIEEMKIGDERHEFKKAGPEAQAVIDEYYRLIPGVKQISKQAKSIAASRGYVKTLLGRHIRFPGGKFTHKASGLVYQGSAGDLNKLNICNICEYLEANDPDSHLLLNIHDEYSLSMSFGSAHHLHEIKRMIEDQPRLRVPLRIDFSDLSSNWWDATISPSFTEC